MKYIKYVLFYVYFRIEAYIEPNKLIIWLRNVDRQLLMQGWQDTIFMGPTALVIMFLSFWILNISPN